MHYGMSMMRETLLRISGANSLNRTRGEELKFIFIFNNGGWDTTRVTKALLHDEAMALLREGTHGIKSVRLARQMETYVRRGSGRVGPQPGSTSDLLLAWMIAQTVASEKAPRVDRPRGPRPTRRVRYAATGY